MKRLIWEDALFKELRILLYFAPAAEIDPFILDFCRFIPAHFRRIIEPSKRTERDSDEDSSGKSPSLPGYRKDGAAGGI